MCGYSALRFKGLGRCMKSLPLAQIEDSGFVDQSYLRVCISVSEKWTKVLGL